MRVWTGAGWTGVGLGRCGLDRCGSGQVRAGQLQGCVLAGWAVIADQAGAGPGGAGPLWGWGLGPHRWPGTLNQSVPPFSVLTTRGLSDAASQSPHTVSGDPNVPVELPPSPASFWKAPFSCVGSGEGGRPVTPRFQFTGEEPLRNLLLMCQIRKSLPGNKV